MKLITDSLTEQLLANGRAQRAAMDKGEDAPDFNVSLIELATVRGKLGLPVERDLHFEAEKTISVYVDEARVHGRIVT